MEFNVHINTGIQNCKLVHLRQYLLPHLVFTLLTTTSLGFPTDPCLLVWLLAYDGFQNELT